MEKISYYSKELILVFCKVVTAVCIAVPLYIKIFYWGEDVNLGIEIFWQILGVSAICTIGSIFIMSPEEQAVSKWKFFFIKFLYFIYINTIVLISAFFFEWFHISDPGQVAGMELVILLVYFGVMWVSYLTDARLTNQMNHMLNTRNKED